MAKKKQTELKVMEALQNDVGRGIARIDEFTMKNLDVTSGDIIEIQGKKNTAAIVWPLHPQDIGAGIIRIDGLLRQNSETSLGDRITISKANASPAKKIIIAPIKHEIKFGGDFASHIKQRFMGRPIMKGDNLSIGVLGQAIPFVVAKTKPTGVVQILTNTNLEIREKPLQMEPIELAVRYEDIGGLKDEISRVREMVELPMKHPELFEKLGILPPKGVLLYGPPGTGKTLIAKAVASETNSYFIPLNGPEIMDKYYGESERKLREIFSEAQQNSPSIIFIDELDSIAPKREETKGEVERRVVAQLLALMDGLMERENVVVIAATNRPNSIDPALRRPGRFDREIEIGVPDREGRKEILQIHTRNMPLSKEVDLDEIASSTHGFVGADLASLSKEAAMQTLKRILPHIDLEKDEIPVELLETLKVERNDFIDAKKLVSPSALREVLVEIPNVKWNDIGGLEEVKNLLREAVEWPMKYPDAFKRMGIRPSKAIMLYGPPGCGKTLLAKAAANESEANLIAVKGPELLSKWVGESEKAVREIFKKAKQTSPTIILFDEIDSLAPRRRGDDSSGSHVSETVVNQILAEMDGIETLENVLIIGATNRPDIVDSALLRPGRFDTRIVVPIPDKKARLQIFGIHTKEMPIDDVDLDELAEKTKEYSGADIEAVCREAAMISLRKNIKSDKVTMEHFKDALKKINPSISRLDIKSFEKEIDADHKEMAFYR
ncbi:MAG: AAA family ATPase [Candidatus Altiarchaeales archaeon ex4484_96]|nr:MAG: AAA family ATPase [Candidatus Altiarchaeales archaeon ex4484_96]